MNKFSDLLNTKNDKDRKRKYLRPSQINEMNEMKRASSDITIERIRNNANTNTDIYDPNAVYGLGTPIDDNVVAELKNAGKHKTKYVKKIRSKSLMRGNYKSSNITEKKNKRKFPIKSYTRRKRIKSPIVGGDKKKRRYVFNDEEY